MKSSEFLSRFCKEYYDEWVVWVPAGQGGPTLAAGFCRSLEVAMGEVDFGAFIEAKEREGAVKILADYRSVAWDKPAVMLLDYV